MSNLLDRSSIVLTPTAYNNGEALCVKPDDASGDFQFSRNSAATRVNSQGLVEDVQILSSNLVQNGSFSQLGSEEVTNGNFSQQGSQLITNGDFATDSDWIKGTGTTISGGNANFVNANGVSLYQNIGTQSGFVKVTFSVTNYTSGTLNVYSGGNQSVAIVNVSANALGDYVAYVNRNGGNVNIIFGSNDGFIGSIDNCSVVEVGQNWSFGTGWSVGEDKAISDGTINVGILQNNIFTSGKLYKISFDVDVTSGTLSARIRFKNDFSATTISNITESGSYTFYQEADRDGLQYINLSDNTATSSITNISVKEVGQNWSVTDQSKIEVGQAELISTDGSSQNISQLNTLVIGKNYRLQYDVLENNSGEISMTLSFGSDYGNLNSTIGTHTIDAIATNTTLQFKRRTGVTDITITNISVIEITDDTNLPRINYEGFSYQDALGSEEIVNGDFATDSNWNKGTGWSISSGVATLDGTQISGGSLGSNVMSVVSGKTYKIVVNVLSKSSGFRIYDTDGVLAYSLSVGENVFYKTVSSATYQITPLGLSGSTGSIDNVSVKEVTGQEVVPDSGCGSWLFEPQSTNLIPYSEDFSNSSWFKINTTITTNTVISPDGTLNADRITATSTGDAAFVRNSQATQATTTTYSFSCFVKKGTTNFVRLANRALGSVSIASAWFDIENGVIGTLGSGLSSSKIEDFGNGWYRCIAIGTTGGTIPNQLIDIAASTTDGATGASIGDFIYLFGAQIEEQTYATSYIPTSGQASGVTRNQDVCTNGGTGTGLINSTEGVLYFEGSVLSNDGTARAITIRQDGGNFIKLLYSPTSNRVDFVAFSSGALSCNITKVISNTIDNAKFGLKWKQNDFALWINGVEVGQDLSGNTPLGMDKISFTNEGGTGDKFFGKTKALAVFPFLTDTELAELTTI